MGFLFINWNIIYRFNEHPCPCVWSIWTEWPTCSSTCGVGSKQRTREVETEAINDGTDCLGDKTETATCNTDPCRKNKNTQTSFSCLVKAKCGDFSWLQQLTVNGASGVNGHNATRLAALVRRARCEHMPSLHSLVERSVKETHKFQLNATLWTTWNKPLQNKLQKSPTLRDSSIIMVKPCHDTLLKWIDQTK